MLLASFLNSLMNCTKQQEEIYTQWYINYNVR